MEESKPRALFGYRPQAVLRVSGADAATFLQGQFSNDLQKGIGAAVYGLWLNQKGKVLADSQVLRLASNEFLLMSAGVEAAVIAQRLEQYLIADEVVICDETENFAALALWGDMPTEGNGHEAEGAWLLPGRGGKENFFELLGAPTAVAAVRAKLEKQGFVAITGAEAERRRIEAGVPAVPVDIGPGDLPNEGGLETSAVSFTKGCYLGQEVMARLKNLGQVRRRLQVVRGTGAPPAALAALYQGELKVGEIRSVAADGDVFVAFAMLSLVNFKPDLGLSLAPDQPISMRLHAHG
jgi:tRNA-modifying protein YgfZ